MCILVRPPKFQCWKGAEANHAATISTQTQVKVGDESRKPACECASECSSAKEEIAIQMNTQLS